MSKDIFLPFDFPAAQRKKVIAAFDGGRISSDGGVMLLAAAERRLGIADKIAAVIRMARVMVDLWCASYTRPPPSVILDIDDTLDVVHGHQQLSLFNAHYDERCFLPLHIYDTQTGRPVAVLLRPGKTPTGVEVRGHLRRLVRWIRHHWPTTRITLRGDAHYGRPEVMDWCDQNGVAFIFGLAGSKPLQAKVEETADAIRTRRAVENREALRGYAETTHKARPWSKERRVAARIEATRLGLDIRFVVTSLTTGTP